jgi:hypothetical protein
LSASLNKLETASTLLNQIIEMEEVRDKEWKAIQIALHKGSRTSGCSKMLFHLRALKELLDEVEHGGKKEG